MIGSNVSAVGMVEALGALDTPAPVYEDNYSATLKSIAAFILDHAPEGLVSRHRADLGRIRLGESEHLHCAEFRRQDAEGNEASCDLYVDLDVWGESRRFVDAEGNLWREVSGARVRVSWSSWGSTEIDIASFRLALMVEVSEFAKRLKAEFSAPVYQIVATTAQRAEQKEAFRKQAFAGKVKSIVEAAPERKGMKVGETRAISAGDGLAIGGDAVGARVGEEWAVTVGSGTKKLSYVAVVAPYGFTIRRVAG